MPTLKQVRVLFDASPVTKKASKSGNDYTSTTIEGVALFDDGSKNVFRAMLFPERGTQAKGYKAGDYVPVFNAQVRNGQLAIELTDLQPAVAAPVRATA